jgi:hypothetical protein
MLNILLQNAFAGAGWTSKILKPRSKNPCEAAFANLLNGSLPAQYVGDPTINMWDPRFKAQSFVEEISNLKTKNEKLKVLSDLKSLVHKDQDFVNSLSDISNLMLKKKLISQKDIESVLLNNSDLSMANFYFSKTTKKVFGKINVDPNKSALVEQFVFAHEMSNSLKKEYIDILMFSNRSADEIQDAISSGLKLRADKASLNQFREYMYFIDPLTSSKAKKALNAIDDIYDSSKAGAKLKLKPKKSYSEKFLLQQSKLRRYEQKRVVKWEKTLKEMDNGKLTSHAKKRARQKAAGEKKIFSRLLNGCNGKGGKSLASAKKKFKRFKIGLSLVGTPTFYYLKNKDKLDKNSENYDPYWFERLGYEMGISLLFTAVANKIVTNTSSSFWSKYLVGYAQFSSLDAVNAYGYDLMFGKTGYASYLQKIYRDDIGQTPLEKEFEKIKSSPTFNDDIKAMYAFLEKRSEDKNLKNFLNKYLNLNTYKSGMDPNKITQEDLETEEGKEMMMELLAEKMYAENMGNWEAFQSGNTGMDRWLFYRVRNIAWDMKGLLMNLAIFQIMCKEPLGKVGSWGLILSMVVANEMLSGDFTYKYRREAINQ